MKASVEINLKGKQFFYPCHYMGPQNVLLSIRVFKDPKDPLPSLKSMCGTILGFSFMAFCFY